MLSASERPAAPGAVAKSSRSIIFSESLSPPTVRRFQPHQLWTSTGGSSLQDMEVIVTSPNLVVSVWFATLAIALVATTTRIMPVTEWRPRYVFSTPFVRSVGLIALNL